MFGLYRGEWMSELDALLFYIISRPTTLRRGVTPPLLLSPKLSVVLYRVEWFCCWAICILKLFEGLFMT